MIDPIFWLGLSLLLVAVSITAVLMVALPAFQELGRAARSAEKLFDTLNRELPPTLEAIRLTGLEISELTDDMSQGVQSAGQVVKQVDQSISGVKQQVQKVQTGSRSMVAGFKAAWKTFTQPAPKARRGDRLPPGSRSPLTLTDPRHPDRNGDEAPLSHTNSSTNYLPYAEPSNALDSDFEELEAEAIEYNPAPLDPVDDRNRSLPDTREVEPYPDNSQPPRRSLNR